MGNFLDLIRNSPQSFGVYRFINEKSEVIYIGKARDLNKRLISYTKQNLAYKVQLAVSLTKEVKWEICSSEAHALILENEYIKKFKPRYNILLKDDKTFPSIYVDEKHDFPLIKYFRGKQTPHGKYFGPFTNAKHAKLAIDLVKKITIIRSCSNSVFASRTRPCLEYQLNRCTAPCVGLVSKDEYSKQINDATDILLGKSDVLHKKFECQIQEAIDESDFKKADLIRIKIEALRYVSNNIKINLKNRKEFNGDIIKKTIKKISSLDDMKKIGENRKKALLTHFGSFKAIKNASLKDISRTQGIGKIIAKTIFDFFHQN